MTDPPEPSRADPDVDRFDQWAATYERSLMQPLFFGPVHKTMLRLLARDGPQTSPGVILDVGCGTGRLLRAASLQWPQARLLGADPAPKMLSEAARLWARRPLAAIAHPEPKGAQDSNLRAAFELASAERLPFPDGSVDLVMTSLSFHHWANQQQGVREIARVLRPGGFFCLADHSMLLARFWRERVRSPWEIRAMMTRAGLAVRRRHFMVLRFILITLAQK